MVKLKDLQYLVAVDQYKHFGQAAEFCHVSQPTLSGQIIKLEEQLGLKLIERHKKRILLTPAGEQLIEQAYRVLEAVEVFDMQAKALLDPLSGSLHVGLIPTLAPYLLPHIMIPLNDALPNIDFYLHEDKTNNLLSSLNAGTLDALILPLIPGMESFDCYDLFDEPLCLAVSDQHDLSAKEQVTLDDLNEESVLTLEDGHCLREQSMGYCFSAGAKEDQKYRAASLETLRYMVAANLGVTLLPELATYHRESDINIRYLPFSDLKPSRNIVLLIRPQYSRMSPIRSIVSTIREVVRGLHIMKKIE